MTVKNKEILELNQPLNITTDRPPFRYDLEFQNYTENEEISRRVYRGNKIDLNSYNAIKFYSKQPQSRLIKWDVLRAFSMLSFIVNEKVKLVFEQLCPQNVQFLPIIIEGKGEKAGVYENHDYYIVNILSVLDILREDVIIDGADFKSYPYLRGLEAFQGSMIAIERRRKSHIFFHPTLAKALAKFKGINFLTEEENAMLNRFKKEN